MTNPSVQTINLYQELTFASQALKKAAESLKRVAHLVKKTSKIDPDQAWFWTKEWQAMEAEADEDIKKGRVVELKDVDDLDKPLNQLFPKP